MYFADLKPGDLLVTPPVESYDADEGGNVLIAIVHKAQTMLVINVKLRYNMGTYKAVDIQLLNEDGEIVQMGRRAASSVAPIIRVFRGGKQINDRVSSAASPSR